MLDSLTGGFGHGYGHNDHRRSGGYGFEERKEFVAHEESEEGYFDRQARYNRHMRLPANHGRPPMAHMPVCDEEESDVEEFFESSQSHHTTVLPHHGNKHHQQPPHMNFMPPPPMAQPHHNGKMGNGWQEDAYHGGHSVHGMQQHHGGHEMQHHGGHGAHGMQQYGVHGMQSHGKHGMQSHDTHGMKVKHHDRLMVPQVSPHSVYMNPDHGSGGGHAVVMKASEQWRMSNSSGGHQKAGWGSKGL
ncbi:hypothetical protein EUTSA_v10019051mg [Eutrema salsugineum]|uniref:Uncharacterized protein n=1 Tax=Eutrema salsugineum TaxID=72664 RepID=V4MBF4_EUTSA|nr:histidine-rich glycoprotein [Eutrema salsugineum]ESQ28496.1 hypothetical protein EUTSA_v10019051mg [Eutrema salsugineum]